MHKNRIILLAICFALLIVTVCGNERTRTDAKSVAHPLSLSPGLLRPKGSPQTVRVRLIEVETNADLIDSPVADSEITIKAGASSLSQKTRSSLINSI